jgi:hypothetical protein
VARTAVWRASVYIREKFVNSLFGGMLHVLLPGYELHETARFRSVSIISTHVLLRVRGTRDRYSRVEQSVTSLLRLSLAVSAMNPSCGPVKEQHQYRVSRPTNG